MLVISAQKKDVLYSASKCKALQLCHFLKADGMEC